MKKRTKKERLERGDAISIKILVSTTDEELEFINNHRSNIPNMLYDKIREEMGQASLVLPLPQPLTAEQRERLADPNVREMLTNINLALLSNQVPFGLGGAAAGPAESKPAEETPAPQEGAEWLNDESFDALMNSIENFGA